MKSNLRIGIVGAGISGNTCAYLLSRQHECFLFESESRLGGHANTQSVKEDFRELAIDTGFIVFNERNYPLFTKLMQKLKVDSYETNMSFAYQHESSGFQYAGTGIRGLFANPSQVFRPKIYGLAFDAFRFYRKGRSFLNQPSDISFAEFLKRHKFSTSFIHQYIVPMCSAIWSAPSSSVLSMPCLFALKFLDNHGLLNLADRPQWRSIRGGSRHYVERLFSESKLHVFKGNPVTQIKRRGGKIQILSKKSDPLECDRVILAVHADQVLDLLEQPTDQERHLFENWKYQVNPTSLHRDRSLLPSNKAAWASWNYIEKKSSGLDQAVAVTYHMNRLQKLNTRHQYFVSLNLDSQIDPQSILYSKNYAHPEFDIQSTRRQKEILEMNGENGSFFAGAYLGNGFHEDGVRSAVEVCGKLGVQF